MRSQFWAIVARRLRSMVEEHTAKGIAGSIVLATSVVSPALAQLPAIPNLQMPPPSPVSNDSDSQVVTTWIRLDGRRLFKIAAPRADLPKRVEDIQQRLRHISQNYFQSDSSELQVQIKTENNLQKKTGEKKPTTSGVG